MEDDTTLDILVTVDASDPSSPTTDLIELLQSHTLYVLGYWNVPDQATPGQLRSQFNDEATSAVEEIAKTFAEAGAAVESRVIFTHDWYVSVDSFAAEQDVDCILTLDAFHERVEHVLVPLRGDANLERIVHVVGLLLRGSNSRATLFNVADDEEAAQTGEFILRGACDRLEDEGIPGSRLNWRQAWDHSPHQEILDVADEYDLIVVGESEPSLTERVFGRVTNQVIAKSPIPVMVVRRH